MVDDELGLTAVFNGCIYDYRELRAELEGHGYRFFSTSDTEVIAQGLPPLGRRTVVDHLHGMFAFAIHERDTGRVVLARDRLGIKPLYLAETPGPAAVRLHAAGAARAAGGVDTSHRPGRAAPLPHLPRRRPGAAHDPDRRPQAAAGDRAGDRARRHRADRARYWEPALRAAPRARGWSAAGLAGRVIEDALRIAVRRRLVADIPVGVLLSGGLDSSLIVGAAGRGGADGPGDLQHRLRGGRRPGGRRVRATPTSSPSTSAPTTTASWCRSDELRRRSRTRSAR